MALIKKMTHTRPDGTKKVRRFLSNKKLADAFLEEVKKADQRNPGGVGAVWVDGKHTHNWVDGHAVPVEEGEDVRED